MFQRRCACFTSIAFEMAFPAAILAITGAAGAGLSFFDSVILTESEKEEIRLREEAIASQQRTYLILGGVGALVVLIVVFTLFRSK